MSSCCISAPLWPVDVFSAARDLSSAARSFFTRSSSRFCGHAIYLFIVLSRQAKAFACARVEAPMPSMIAHSTTVLLNVKLLAAAGLSTSLSILFERGL